MGKPKKLRDDRILTAAIDERVEETTVTEQPDATVVISGECETTEVPLPKARRYSPPTCSMCTALRPTGKDYTEVYRTTREDGYIFRYCKCGFCGNTFKDSERVLTQKEIEAEKKRIADEAMIDAIASDVVNSRQDSERV